MVKMKNSNDARGKQQHHHDLMYTHHPCHAIPLHCIPSNPGANHINIMYLMSIVWNQAEPRCVWLCPGITPLETREKKSTQIPHKIICITHFHRGLHACLLIVHVCKRYATLWSIKKWRKTRERQRRQRQQHSSRPYEILLHFVCGIGEHTLQWNDKFSHSVD